MKLFDLTGRVAAITGTSRGIGRELALGFAEAGATVVGCARSYENAEKTAADLRAKGHDTLSVLADAVKRQTGALDLSGPGAGRSAKN